MGRIYKRNGTYFADLRPEGGGRFSLQTSNRQVAKARLHKAELGETSEASAAYPFELAIDDMLATKREETRSSYECKARNLTRLLGDERDVNTLTRGEIVSYAKARREEPGRGGKKISDHTIHKELVVLRQTLKEGLKRGTYRGSVDIVPNWKASYTPKTRHLTQEEFETLIAHTPLEHRMWIVLQVYTSANKSEVESMGWTHIDLKQGEVRVPGTKRTTRWRTVPIHPVLRKRLMAADRSEPLVAPWPRVNHDLSKICIDAGLEHLSTNDLRRTFAAWLKQAGVDSLPVAHMMGHSSTIMVERVYGRLNAETYRDAIGNLPTTGKKPKAVK